MIDEFRQQLAGITPTALTGSVARVEGLTAAIADFPAPVGAVVEIERQAAEPARGEVIGFRQSHTLVQPYGDLTGVRRGNRARVTRTARYLRVGDELLGRVVNAHGATIDGLPAPMLWRRVPLHRAPPPPLERPRIDTPLATGVRVIDGLLACGAGQRLGLFAGAGVGKSVLLGMLARFASADVIVIGLVGERGREVNEFLERDLGPTGRARSVTVVATSDESALLRVQAAQTATAIAEYFRDQGKQVLLVLDSLTRFALAQREIGLAAGEPPTTRGFPPSVFALLPRLVERAGRGPTGAITAFYSVLVEGDDPQEPVSDTVRGLLDGHALLSRKLAGVGHFPAVDVLASLSRLMNDIAPPEQRAAAQTTRELLSALRDHEDLIAVGAYKAGANPLVDTALAMKDEIAEFCRQAIEEKAELAATRQRLVQLAAKALATRKPRG